MTETTSKKPRTALGRGLKTFGIIRAILGGLVYIAFAAFYLISYMNGEGEPLLNIGLAAINAVADNAIPDVKSDDASAKEIYTFYRAGILTGSGRECPILEVEIECKSGSEEAAARYARDLAAKYGLVPEHRSKFARALALAAGTNA